MAWYEEAVFYHIYPLGMTGAPEYNDYGQPADRFAGMEEWIGHMKDCGFTALYFGPCFSSGSHGYDTADYRRVDERLGTNDDLKEMVRLCHENGIRVILDGVFNHTGRDFFAFRDIRENRENSQYLGWYCNVNLGGNNEYGDGFSYETWGGYDMLPKLDLRNPAVREYHLETIRFWVNEFDIDGLRLDAADVMDIGFLQEMRRFTSALKEDFWLMGEVIHGDYSRWVNSGTLHSVTNYALHKALFSGHNDHNYFEIAHTIRRQIQMGLGGDVRLYSFVDNHDVERIMTKLRDKSHFLPVHVLLYTLPGIPSVYYGSEFGIEGRKEWGSDASLRPALSLAELSAQQNAPLEIIKALGKVHMQEPALWYGDYRELELTTTKYAFMRGDVLVTVTNSGREDFAVELEGTYTGVLSGRKISSDYGWLRFDLEGGSGEIWIPEDARKSYEPLKHRIEENTQSCGKTAAEASEMSHSANAGQNQMPQSADAGQNQMPQSTNAWQNPDDLPQRADPGKSLEDMTIEELQAEVLARLSANGPLTDRMIREVQENVYRDSLLNWVRSFR